MKIVIVSILDSSKCEQPIPGTEWDSFLRGKNIIRNLYYSKISKRKLKKIYTISSGTGKNTTS